MRRPDWADLHGWKIERDATAPLFRQIYLQVRTAITSHTFRPGTRLPSSRALATRLGVSRASVIAAYEELLAEGYLAGKLGSGTYIAEDLPAPTSRAVGRQAARSASLPAHARPLEHLRLTARPPQGVPFATGRSGVDARTLAAWRKIGHKVLRRFDPAHLTYGDPRGLLALREAVADYLRAARAVRCDPDQIVITSGTQQAIDIGIRILLRPGDKVWMEDPGYLLTRGALIAAGMKVRPVPVDRHGLVVSAGVRSAPRARAAYVTPSHQFPMGIVLSMARRMALLAWARANDAWIIEDDYDSVFRYAGRPLASLQGLDDSGRVIYVGSLNKVLFPGLRLGYAVVPKALLPAYVNVRNLIDRHPPSFNQSVLAAFMAQGHFTAHLRRTRIAYRVARDSLCAELERRGRGLLTVDPPEQGMHLVAMLPPGASDVSIEAAAQRAGIAVRALSRTYIKAPPRHGLILGFTGHPLAEIVGTAARLVEVVRAELKAPKAKQPGRKSARPASMLQ